MSARLRALAVSILLASAMPAQQANFTNTGGTVTLGTDFVLAGSVLASPPGTVSLSCPVTALPPAPIRRSGSAQAEHLPFSRATG